MSIFDTEKDHFNNIDESIAGNSLKDIMDFIFPRIYTIIVLQNKIGRILKNILV